VPDFRLMVRDGGWGATSLPLLKSEELGGRGAGGKGGGRGAGRGGVGHLCRVDGLINQRNLDVLCSFDDVVIGNQMT